MVSSTVDDKLVREIEEAYEMAHNSWPSSLYYPNNNNNGSSAVPSNGSRAHPRAPVVIPQSMPPLLEQRFQNMVGISDLHLGMKFQLSACFSAFFKRKKILND